MRGEREREREREKERDRDRDRERERETRCYNSECLTTVSHCDTAATLLAVSKIGIDSGYNYLPLRLRESPLTSW